MTDEITPEIFQHMVKLAALELSETEAEYLRRQLNNQLRAIQELQAIPLAGEQEITSHGVKYDTDNTPPIREDAWLACPNPDEIIAQAPETIDGYILVPDIRHQELK
jgi:aspartyl/glutamyl-tRNA(Asn/Gln) amidotransferase C subunit